MTKNRVHNNKAKPEKGKASSNKISPKRKALLKKKEASKKVKKEGHVLSSNSKRYKQGKFWSKKNQKEFIFRSAYEFGYFILLEEDIDVVSYIVEPFQVHYRFKGVNRKYWPDLLVLYRDGSMKILEVKPKSMLKSAQVRAKAAGCKLFIKSALKNTSYHFITEEDIFESQADYKKLVRKMRVN